MFPLVEAIQILLNAENILMTLYKFQLNYKNIHESIEGKDCNDSLIKTIFNRVCNKRLSIKLRATR